VIVFAVCALTLEIAPRVTAWVGFKNAGIAERDTRCEGKHLERDVRSGTHIG